MSYSCFPKHPNDALTEPLFLGNPVNISRYDQQKYPIFENLIERQLSFFWRPEEVDLTQDRIDYQNLPAHEQHIFISNLKYQTLLDSIQGRSPNIAFLPLCSLPELETWITTWTFSETIHSRSYTHIIRNLFANPAIVFEEIMRNTEILARAEDIGDYYDALITQSQRYLLQGFENEADLIELKTKLYFCLFSVNALEAIRFYVSFACAFAFAEREKMEGNAKIMRLIARDEMLHLEGTQVLLNLLASGQEGQLFKTIAEKNKNHAIDIFTKVIAQEKAWANYLFSQGSMIGLNSDILCQYIDYISDIRLESLHLPRLSQQKHHPIPWIEHYLQSDTVQVAPQEVELSSYLISQIDTQIDTQNFKRWQL